MAVPNITRLFLRGMTRSSNQTLRLIVRTLFPNGSNDAPQGIWSNREQSEKSIEFAKQFDVETVWQNHWQPYLDKVFG